MDSTEERLKMVFAGGIEVDVTTDDHLIVVFTIEGRENISRILSIAAENRLIGFGHTHWCVCESLALDVFTESGDKLGDQLSDSVFVHMVICSLVSRDARWVAMDRPEVGWVSLGAISSSGVRIKARSSIRG